MDDQLTIKAIKTQVIEEPLKRPFVTHLHTVNAIHAVQVKVSLANGMVGTGAATPNEKVTGDTMATLQTVLERTIGPQIVGQSLARLEPLMQSLQASIRYNMPAKAAIDLAIYDLLCQLENTSLTRLLGGAKQSMATDYTISIGDLPTMVAHAKELVKQGFESLKIKIGNQPVPVDVQTVKAIAQAVGPKISLRLDVNQGWSLFQARQAVRLLGAAGLNIDFLEQPLPAGNLDGLALLRQSSPIPIMLDESVMTPADALRVAAAHAADYVNIKLMKSGGLYQATRINQICETAGIPCMVGCMIEPQTSLCAAVAFANAHANVHFIDLDSVFMAKNDEFGRLHHAGARLWLREN